MNDFERPVERAKASKRFSIEASSRIEVAIEPIKPEYKLSAVSASKAIKAHELSEENCA